MKSQKIKAKIEKIWENKRRLVQRALRVGLIFGTTLLSHDSDAQAMKNPEVIDMNAPKPKTPVFDADAYLAKMFSEGRFFVNMENDSVIYRTNEQIKNENIPVVSRIFDVTMARETGTPHTADEASIAKAYEATGTSYMGLYQYSQTNFQNMILYGLIQSESPEIRKLCQSVLKPGISADHPALKELRKAYEKSLTDMNKGVKSTKALNEVFATAGALRRRCVGLLCVSNVAASKIWTKKLNKMDSKAFQKLQDNYCLDVYLQLTRDALARSSIPIEYFALLVTADVHRYSASTVKDLQNGQPKAVLTREAGQSPHKGKMKAAHENIVKTIGGQKCLDLRYVLECARAGADVNMLALTENLKSCAYSHYQIEQSGRLAEYIYMPLVAQR